MNYLKGIVVGLPNTITLSELFFLNYLDERYGETLNSISNQMINKGELPLVIFKTKENENIFCRSFKELIQCAKNNLVDYNKEVINEKYLIETIIDEIKK